MTNVKLSQIASGGMFAPSTDNVVTVRTGNTDVLTTFGTASVENLATVIIDDGAGNLTIGAGQVTNAMLATPPSVFTWNEITTTSHALAVGNGYVMNNASQVIGTLPSASVFGAEIKVVGKGAGGWKIAQNSGQTIHFDGNSTTTGTGGSLSSQSSFDCVSLLCITANTDFLITSSIGNITGV